MEEKVTIKASITKEESYRARKFANSEGYTYQGWIGKLIRQAMQQNLPDQHPTTDREDR